MGLVVMSTGCALTEEGDLGDQRALRPLLARLGGAPGAPVQGRQRALQHMLHNRHRGPSILHMLSYLSMLVCSSIMGSIRASG